MGTYYLLITDLLQTNSFVDFIKLKQQLFAQKELVPKEILTDLLLFLINFAQVQNTKGNTNYPKEGLEIYQFLLDEVLLPQDNKLRTTEFLSIIMLGYHQKQFLWTDQFILAYEQYLSTEIRTDFLPLVKAFQYYHKGVYDKIRPALNLAKPKNNLQYYHRIMSLLIRGMYEQWIPHKNNLYEVLISFLNAFERSLNRNKKLDKESILAYKNFIRITKKLIEHQQKGKDPKQFVPKLIKLVLDTPIIAFRNWLLEKLNDLLSGGNYSSFEE